MAEEDWDKLIDQYDRGHRGNSVINLNDDDDDMPPPPPPPPPAGGSRGPPPPPVAVGHRGPPPGAPPPNALRPPPPLTAAQQAGSTTPQGGIAAQIAARNAAAAAAAAGVAQQGRRDSNPPPPPPPPSKGPPPPPARVPMVAAGTSPESMPPPPPPPSSHSSSSGSTGNAGTPAQQASLMKVMGAAATGLWGLIQTGGSTLAPVMQELAATYSPFPDSGALQAQPDLRQKLGAGVKVVVTAPKIRRMHSASRSSAQGFTSPSGLRSPDGADDDGELWSEANQRHADLASRVWLRFIEPKSGSVLYFSTKTNSAQGDRPADYDGSDDEDEDEDVFADEDPYGGGDLPGTVSLAQLDKMAPRRTRAESIILSEAWDDQNKSGSTPPGGKGLMSPGGSAPGGIDPRLLGGRGVGVPPSPHSASASSSAHGPGMRRGSDEEFVPLSAAETKGPAGAQAQKVSLESFLSGTTLYTKQLEQLLESCGSAAAASASTTTGTAAKATQLSEEMESKLKSLLAGLQDLQRLMDSGSSSGGPGGERGNDVDALVLLDKLSWDFGPSNSHVSRYRKGASLRAGQHAKAAYSSWHLPSYLSTFPLPPDTKAVTIVVKLPESGLPLAGDVAGSASTTRIGVSEKDSCAAAIAMAFKKCEGKLADRSLSVQDFVLKGSGIADYMFGEERKIMDYEYIRMCVRNGEEVKLSLVRRPAPTPEPEGAAELVKAYLEKVDHTVSVVDPDLVYRDVSSKDLQYIPLCELTHLPFRLKLLGLDNFSEGSMPRFETVCNLYVRVFLFYGCKNVAEPQQSDVQEVASDPRWHQWLVYKDLTLASVPRGSRLGFILCGRKVAKPEKEIMLGWVVHQLVDEVGHLSRGRLALRLWSNKARTKGKHGKPREPDVSFLHRATTAQNLADANVATLHIQLDDFCLPVVAPVSERYREPNARVVGPEIPLKSLSKDQAKQFEGLLACDILRELTSDDQILLWNMRHHLVRNPSALSKFLQCVDWKHVDKRMEAYRLLELWAHPPSAVTALELLDAKFPDPVVRKYAIGLLSGLKDDELRSYLLQLVQSLKFEAYHDSPLSRFLISRALAAPMVVGHYFFWHLKAEVHAPHCCERFGLVLEEYLSFAGRFTAELRKQASAVLRLQRVAEMVVRLKRDHGYSDPEAMKEYTKECDKLNRDFFGPQGKFQLPLDPKVEVTQLVVEKCRYMSSKMVPLWLVFRNADPDAPNVYVIFKSGDDLRQDILTLQILTLMDAMWLQSGLDAKMKPYKCIATGVNEHGEGVGLIEVVLNSDTTSGIQLKYGGGAVGALKMDPLDLFLREHNRIAKDYDRAVDNFVCSCAGYCVATFVLGIGDRHNGNIMVTKDGHLFHIDFGHFLGNFKQKFGINRERAAFVFTPEMAFVMGGTKYRSSALFKKFLDYCSRAFKTLRVHANLLETLFGLMVAAGMPELIKETDIYYMRDKLLLHEKESKAEKKLNEEIENSLDSKYRRFDNFIHNIRHG